MEQTNRTQVNPAENQESEGRREAVRKLGKYAAYAAPFTLLASNLKAGGAGSGFGGGPEAAPGGSARRR